MNSKLFIPKKCKVGFNQRTDTYTQLLGYIIAWDGKKWRKEPSWEGWREKYITDEEFQSLKRKDFEEKLESTKNRYTEYKGFYKSNPQRNVYYKTYAEMSEEEFLKLYNLHDYSKFVFYPGKLSNNPKVQPVEFENVPTSGFVLNKKAGGYSTGWNHRSTYCRVWDPRGWEFEISIPNLLYILQESSSFKGKGLDGEFIYSWDGKDLVLLPCCSSEYKKSDEFTKLQNVKFSAKDLIVGYFYQTKNQETVTYLGRYDTYEPVNISSKQKISSSKSYIFENKDSFISMSVDKISSCIGKDDKASDKLEKFLDKCKENQVKCLLEDKVQLTTDNQYVFKKEGDVYKRYNVIYNQEKVIYGQTYSPYYTISLERTSYKVQNGRFISIYDNNRDYKYINPNITKEEIEKDYVSLKMEKMNGKIVNIK